eukprot:CAMPEP_0172439308 /NCGR_PEP_ID=MMETSP1065-20121228/341_1 /TAXON_ID=265537 /ORGANISM="Amphiprora paludosa, Strain CCMP125" /LENGTH=198 /DNA_ID=CAMNT_0013187975 /DNA_START=167 /DNA_END=763 /DNA_ORIENTATION=-
MGNSASSSSLPPLKTVSSCNTNKVMGTWFVIGVKPTAFETTCSNAVEIYSRADPKKNNDVNIDFQYNKNDPITSPLKSLPQKGWVQGDKEDSGEWKVSPVWPIKMPYLILDVDQQDYQYVLIGYPSRDYAWIMGRTPNMPEETYNMLTKQLEEKHQYNLEGLRKVPQVWTAAERTKRGFTEKEIPDSMLVSEAAATSK